MPPEVATGLAPDGNPLQSLLVLLAILGAGGFIVIGLLGRQSPVSSPPTQSRKPPLLGSARRKLTAESRSPRKSSFRGKRASRSAGDAPGEKRREIRRAGGVVSVLLKDLGAAEEAAEAVVLDRSKGGLLLSLDRALPIGRVISLRAVNAPDDLPWVNLTVRRCRKKGEGWELGCQFVDELPWSVLLLFG
jgi:hypothetical protein